jgi:hypothetical protein
MIYIKSEAEDSGDEEQGKDGGESFHYSYMS